MSVELQTELNEVQAILAGVPEELSSPLREMVAAQLDTLKPYWRALFVLAAGTYEQEPENTRIKRIHLAAALEMLNLAQNIHRHLILDDSRNADTLSNKSLIGSMILAGDYCFSRSANLAAFTDSPKVVSIFSEALGTVSEKQLRSFDSRNINQNLTEQQEADLSPRNRKNSGTLSSLSDENSSADQNSYNELPELLHAGTLAAIEIAQIEPPMADRVLYIGKIVADLYVQHAANNNATRPAIQEVQGPNSILAGTSEESSDAARSIGLGEGQTPTNIVQIINKLPSLQRPRWEFLLRKLGCLPV